MRGCTCHGSVLCPWCTALAQLAGVASPVTMPTVVSEKAFQGAVLRIAKEHGWLCYFTKDSRRSPQGYPDLTLVKGNRCLWAELKVPGGSLTLQQAHWLRALGQVERTEAQVWTPEDMPVIAERLRG